MGTIDKMIADLRERLRQAEAQANYLAGQIAALETLRNMGAVVPDQPDNPAQQTIP